MTNKQKQKKTKPNELTLGFAKKLDSALETLEQASSFAKARYQTDVFRLATDLMDQPQGIDILYERAPHFDTAGVFHGGPWEDPCKLLSTLVGACLKGESMYPTLEALSELRMLAIATGRQEHESLTAEEAKAFLKTTMALNLDLLFPEATEESRMRPKVFQRAYNLFDLIKREISLEGLQEQLLEEIEFLLAQRPILSERLIKLITYVNKLPSEGMDTETAQQLKLYYSAVTQPSPLSKASDASITKYRQLLKGAKAETIQEEIQAFKNVLVQTGLGNPYHAVLLRHLGRKKPELIPEALALDKVGVAAFEENQDFALQLLKVAIFPATSQSIYGFAQAIKRGLLSRPEVGNALDQLVSLQIAPAVEKQLLETIDENKAGLSANSVLIAGTLSVLGQPLGIGQGLNPTCQAARGISLWAQHAPGYLLQIITTAARNNVIEMDFEGKHLKSDHLHGGVARGRIDSSLDPVSMVLVPHLDKLYDEMMRLASLRGQDQHKWVNPVFYGRWVPKGFASVFDVLSNGIKDYAGFVRRFFSTHHPEYNDGSPLVYPNPVGIFVTDIHGNLLGLHAVSIQRVEEDQEGLLRVYFFNPNNEGRQQWGNAIETTVSGHGERHGESSLPFEQFTSRLYAFHYNPYEEGDAFAVPDKVVNDLTEIARGSWGKSYTWSS